ncbi:MAG: hypothetical protein AAFY66_14975 [Pseudomonadota bacterium]
MAVGGSEPAPADATPHRIAVLTGDVVKSSALPATALDALFGALERGRRDAASWAGPIGKLSRYRGDGWQLVTDAPGAALRLGLFLRATLLAENTDFDTRISIGIGEGAFDAGDPGLLDGAAFQRSGRALEQMRRDERLLLAGPQDVALLPPAIALLDALCRRWTQAQCKVLRHALALPAPLQKDIASRLSVEPQTVSDHLARANFEPVAAFCAGVEEYWAGLQADQPDKADSSVSAF